MVLSEAACLRYLKDSVEKHKTQRFFTDAELQQTAKNAVGRLDKWGAVAKEYGFEDSEIREYAYSMLQVALYQIHILLGALCVSCVEITETVP